MAKMCADVAMMNTIITKPSHLVWMATYAPSGTLAVQDDSLMKLEDLFSASQNDGPKVWVDNIMSHLDLRHYNLSNCLVSQWGVREKMDDTWTAELLLQDTVIGLDLHRHTLDKAQGWLLDNVGL